MKIYLISLEKDVERRDVLKLSLPIAYESMEWIHAKNGKDMLAKDYFFYANQFYEYNRKLITPSEVGCTLSHIQAYKEFLKTDEEYCLIIEDDIIGNDDDIKNIENIIKNEKPNGLVLFGGQEGVPSDYWNYILAIKTKSLYCISNFSKKFLFGAYCYTINRNVAKELIDMHEKDFQFADNWGSLLKENKMYYISLIEHPKDFSNSNIEKERHLVYLIQNKIFKENYIQGVFFKILNRIRNDITRYLLIIKGYKNIK